MLERSSERDFGSAQACLKRRSNEAGGTLLVDPQFLDPISQLAKRQAQQLGRGRLVVPSLFQRLDDGLTLHILDLIAEVRARKCCRAVAYRRRAAQIQVGDEDCAARTQSYCAFEHVFELTDVAREGIGEQGLSGAVIQRDTRAELLQYVLCKFDDIVAAIA